ncbi:MAG: hypothetical protein LBM74_07450 [Oscillospiraceae bacterium]|nr:hypothetical protein [Oscillospiraceae bacterium]
MSVAQTLFVPALALNTAAAVSGQILPHVVTKAMIDVFVLMGGSGAMLALLIALLEEYTIPSYIKGFNKKERTT